MSVTVKWTVFKDFVDDRSLSIQFLEDDEFYYLKAFDEGFSLDCNLSKTVDTDDIAVFEADYKANGNKKLRAPSDSDGSPLQRIKITTSGWSYQLHGVEYKTSQFGSVYSKKQDGTDFGFATLKLFKDVAGSMVECSDQADADANCVMTQFDWEPTHDYEIIGGLFKQRSLPTQDVRLWVIGVPDVPAAYGGSKLFAANINLLFVGLEEGVKVDGRAPKYLTYSATNHTNKLRLILKHPAGLKHDIHMVFEIFKA